ncbi:hypothetical protein [Vibrio hippocampi]|nr:hypothetical protein [Vibrio hippocampi]
MAVFLYDDAYLNTLLTKRPYIWGVYIENALSNVMSFLMGHGRISGDFAEQVGVIVSEEFGIGRKYSAHSFYINFIYEHGFVGLITFLSMIFYALKKNVSLALMKYNEYVLFTLIAGLVIPMYIGGVSVFDILLTYLILRLFVVSNENSTYN